MNDFFLKENTDFTPFSTQHLLVVLMLFLFGFILIRWAIKQSEKRQILIGNILAISISLFVIIGFAIKLFSDNFNIQEHLPLHLCSILALTIPIVSIKRIYLHYEIIFFLILAGTLQSLITPSSYSF
ncbi:hypothetical protein [Polaribacter uvawellassae]|uniref:TMEM164 family acyltransferase n=1 Tax=Polaribacter uvawellassae TaxID=3133495 RepID=UPI00321B2FF4